MFECVIRFLIIFCQGNETNKKEILIRFDDLLNLINYQVKAEKLLGIIVKSVCKKEFEFKPYLQAIFQKLVSPNITKVGQTHIFQMLQTFLYKENIPIINSVSDSIKLQKRIYKESTLIPENQQKILNLILQINLVQPFLETHKCSNDFAKYFNDKKIKQEIYMYKSMMKLLSTLSENNQLGIIQCQRIMAYDDLKQLLNPLAQTPYIIKKEILKVLFQIYVQSTDDTNNAFSMEEMVDLLKTVVLRDLSQFSKHIEGLIDPENKTLFEDDEKKKNGLILQQNIKEYVKEFLEEKVTSIPQNSGLQYQSNVSKEDNPTDIVVSQREYWDYLYSGDNWNFTKDGLLQIILDFYKEIEKRKWLAFETSEGDRKATAEDDLSDYLLHIKLICTSIRGILKKIQYKFQINLSQLTYMFSECIIQNAVKKQRQYLKNLNEYIRLNSIENKLRDNRVEDLDIYVKSFSETKLTFIYDQIDKHKNLKDRMLEFDKSMKEPPKELIQLQEKPNQASTAQNKEEKRKKHIEKFEEKKNSIITYFLFFEKVRYLILQKFVTIHQIYQIFDSKYNPLDQNEEFQREENKLIIQMDNDNIYGGQMGFGHMSQPNIRLIKKEVFITKFVNLMKDIGIFGVQDQNYIDYDDINFFFNAFIITYPFETKGNGIQIGNVANTSLGGVEKNQNVGGQNKQKNQDPIQIMDKQIFLKKLSRYIEKNKSTYNKDQKNDLIQLTANEKSYQQLESLKKYTSIFSKVSVELGKEKPFKIFAANIMNELLQCSDIDQRRKIKIFFEQVVILLKKKDPHYFNILIHFIEDLGVVQNQSINLVQNSQKSIGINNKALDQFGMSTKSARDNKKIFHPQKYLKISQNLIWNLKLYYQILVTISDIYSDQQPVTNLNKNSIQTSSNTNTNAQNAQQQQDGQNNPLQDNQNQSTMFYQVKTLVKKKEENISILLNCMKIINGLYSLNLKHSHAQLLSILKKPSNIKITRNFLSFINQSFSNYLQAIENLSNLDSRQQNLFLEKQQELQLQEEIVLQVLKVIENSCELCNEEFQNFFRTQNIVSSQSYVPLNIISEILFFLTNFTQLKCSYFSSFYKNPSEIKQTFDSGQNLRYYLVINQCISTLKNLCNGTSPKNKDLLLSNNHFLIQLNAIITESELDLQSENLKDIRILQTISNSIDLLLTIIVCSNNQNSLLRLISIMNMEKLIKLLNFIYHNKIKSRLQIIQQEQMCTHQDSFTCSSSVCYKKCITYHDQLVMRVIYHSYFIEFKNKYLLQKKLAFNIVIVIELILDTVNEEDINMKMRMQEENTLLLGIFLEMKKKDDYSDIYQNKENGNITDETSNENKQLIQRKSSRDRYSKIFDHKKSLLFRNSKTSRKIRKMTSKKTTTLHNMLYNEIKEDQSSRQDEADNFYQEQLAQDIGVQKEVHPTSKISYLKKERLYLKESLSFYLQFVGSVEIVKEKQISKLFFRIPLLSSYLTHNIRKNLIHKAVDFSDKNRLKLLIRYSEYFQHEMRFCQKLSKYQLMIYAVEYRSSLNTLIFIIVLIINLIYLFKLKIMENGSSYLDDSEDIVFNVLKMVHIIFTFISMIIVTLERYPVVTYQKFIELKQTYRNKIVNSVLKHKLVSFAFDFDFDYYLIYLILSISALNNMIIYSVLLIDIVKQSEDLKQIVSVFKLNLHKLIKTTILCFLIIFIYSLIGAIVFTTDFSGSENFGSIDQNSRYSIFYFFSIALLEGILNPQGIHVALTIAGSVDKGQYWDRFFYDVSFWIIINFLFLDMMLGSIIDSYAEFRNLQRKYEKNIKRKCFICSLTVEDLETRTLDWDQHIKYEHNLNNYLNYIIYIKSKPIDECDGIEKYVKECISKELTDFFPQRNTLSLERSEHKKI